MKLAEAEVMRGLDEAAISDYGIPGIVLMENAGKGTVDAIISNYGSLANKVVSIVVGPGNNGGDGLVIARHLHQLGSRPYVFMLVDPKKLSGDAAINFQIVDKLPINLVVVKESDDCNDCAAILKHSAVVVDAIFGTGLKREVAGIFAKIIGLINQVGRPVVAVDIASGLDSDSGQTLGCSVAADLTVTYGLAKPGHVCYPGTALTGKLQVADIGIPPEVVEKAAITLDLLQKNEVANLLPARSQISHKGTFGHLLVLAGSQGKTGAAILAVQAALRSGVGLVSLGAAQQLNPIYETSLIEAMTVPLASDYALGMNDYPAIETAMQGKSALVLGPGIGTEDDTSELVQRLFEDVDLPMVVDADALNIFAKSPVSKVAAMRVFTPHPREMARLTGLTTKEVQTNRRVVAQRYAVENGVVVVLKGAATIIASPDGKVAINPTGNSGLATGGTGDVLAGLIGSLLAQGMDAWGAACLGVYVHGLAADRIADNNGIQCGFLASELAAELPLALHELEEV